MKAILFDLDGTIVNSEEGVTKCVQYALKSFGIEEEDLTALKCFIGPPLETMFREKYGMTKEQAWEAVQKYRERFQVTGIFECELYNGIAKAIRELKEKGYIIALASSKPEGFCRRILDHFSLTEYFTMIVGATLDGRISTKQEVLEELGKRMEHLSIPKEEMCLIGDTRYDVTGAKQFGIDCIGVSFGFGTKEELEKAGAVCVCDTIEEVCAYIYGKEQ